MDMQSSSTVKYSSEQKETNSKEDFYRFGSFICCCAMLALAIFGICGNALSIKIFGRPQMRFYAINNILIGLSAIDLALVIFSIPTFLLMGFNGYFELGSSAFNSIVTRCQYATYPFALSARTASIWIMMVITVERWVAVVRPLKANHHLTVSKAKWAIVLTCVAALLYNLVRWFEYELVASRNSRTGNLTLQMTMLRKSETYYVIYYLGLYIVTHFSIPFLVTIALNAQMAWAICKAVNERSRLTRRQRSEHKTASMIIIIVTVYIFCNTMPFVVNVIEGVNRKVFETSSAYFILDISNVLVIFNSTSTCVIYYICSERYRFFCNQLLCHCKDAQMPFEMRLRRNSSYLIVRWSRDSQESTPSCQQHNSNGKEDLDCIMHNHNRKCRYV